MDLVLHMIDGKDIRLKLKDYSNESGDDRYFISSYGKGTIGAFRMYVLPILERGSGVLDVNDKHFDEQGEKFIFIRNILWFELEEGYVSDGLRARYWESH